jgi:hypothetical protein
MLDSEGVLFLFQIKVVSLVRAHRSVVRGAWAPITPRLVFLPRYQQSLLSATSLA